MVWGAIAFSDEQVKEHNKEMREYVEYILDIKDKGMQKKKCYLLFPVALSHKHLSMTVSLQSTRFNYFLLYHLTLNVSSCIFTIPFLLVI